MAHTLEKPKQEVQLQPAAIAQSIVKPNISRPIPWGIVIPAIAGIGIAVFLKRKKK